MRFRLVVEYDGTEYSGWQIQPNGPTIQAVLEAAVERLFGQPLRVLAAGRTDAGVHASGQVACFSVERQIDPQVVLRALNALTPRDVTIRSTEIVSDDFDPRRHARRRAYVYRIWNARFPSPFWQRYAWHVPRLLDDQAMRTAAGQLVGTHDFSSFQAAGCDADNPVRRITRSEITREGDLLVYEVEATAFLRHMVRTIVGTLTEIGLGDRPPDGMQRLLEARDRSQAGVTAPPQGLCLNRVDY